MALETGARPWHWRLEHLYHAGYDTGRGRIVHCPPGGPERVALVAVAWAQAHAAWVALTRINPWQAAA
jgi:hypothetical protein